ncbi:hypothetical protein FHX81_4186 [Saccharothrix saharensis]|uniref:Glycosyltransferase RgtA/B/C/D-like domain-containing protein n=1 Tax=Saccharothrix saharensis TaxID=571190 RepID=A0A543JG50_9PSEU|nr:DUF6541 family protein [Saccharothrix saharensis]TQM81802.1 hypothetical protein FHX81_4186 [Saccharothrix saharensis]
MLDIVTDTAQVTLVATAVTAALLWLPGAVLAALVGLRGWLLAGVAPAVTMGLVALAAPLASGLGLRWNTLYFLSFTALVVVLAAGGLVLLRRRGLPLSTPLIPWSRLGSLSVLAGVVVGFGIAVVLVHEATKGIGSVPQAWDAPFHGNAIRRIAETGQSGTRVLGWIDQPDSPAGAFYPHVYHCFEALIYQLTDAGVPRVMNTGMLVTTSLVVPLGTVALVRAVGGNAGFAAAAALVSTSFANYPWDLYQWGQLFPYAAGLSLVLPFLALMAHWLGSGFDRVVVLVAVVGVGLAGTHSAMVFVAAILGLCYTVHRIATGPRAWVRHDLPRLAGVGIAVGLLGWPYLVGAGASAGSTAAFDWPAVTSPSKALGDGVLLGSDADWPQWLLAGFVLLGLFLMLRDGVVRWLATAYGIFLVLFVAASAIDFPWATAVTSPWWNDRFRLGAALILPATIAAGWGLQAAVKAVAGLPAKVDPRLGTGRAAVALLGVVAVLFAAAYVGETKGYVKRNAVRLYWAFNSPILSKLEQDGLRELAALAKPGERVMNDGGDGTVWTYALTGVEPVVGHYISQKPSPRRQLLLDDFDELGTNPSVAQAVRDLNVHYVLVGTGYMGQFRRAPGLTNLDGLPQLTLKYANADIALYEVDWSKMAPTTATQ